MGRYGQLVIGPAGSGKSTYCANIQQHCDTVRRTVHIVNLDPAAEHLPYEPSVDVRDLISVSDVMEELDYGPNGGLVYCMEYLAENLNDWFLEELGEYEDDYVLFDCPGQIELYVHLPVMRAITSAITNCGYRLCGVYIMDSMFISEPSRYVSGSLTCLAAMMSLQLPHLNVLSKCDLLAAQPDEDSLIPDSETLLPLLNDPSRTSSALSSRFQRLNEALVDLLDSYRLVKLIPLDIRDEDSLQYVLSYCDHILQYDEDIEPKDPDDEGGFAGGEDDGEV